MALATGALWIWLSAIQRGQFVWMIWSDRDLVRSHAALSALPTTGAELSSGLGARVPGIAYPLALWSSLRLSDDPVAVWRVQAALAVLAGLVIARELRVRLGLWAAGVGLAAFLASELLVPTVSRLWNPGWLPLPVAIAWVAAVRVVLDDEVAALWAWAAAVAIAAQMHMSALLLVPATLPFLVGTRTARARRGWAGALLAAVLCYAPHLADEALHGWPNTRALLEPQQTGSLGSGVFGPNALRSLTGIWGLLIGANQENALPGLPVIVQVVLRASLVVVAALTSLWVARPSSSPAGASRWMARLALAQLVVVGLAYVRARDLVVIGGEAARYVLVLAPAWATLIAVLAGRLGEVRVAALKLVAVAPIVLVLVVELRDADISLRGNGRHITSWARVQRLIEGAEATTRTPLAELAGRLAVARPDPRVGAWRVAVPVPVDYLLEREGAVFPGSTAGTCLLALAAVEPRTDPPFDGSVAALSALLGEGIRVVSVIGSDRLAEDATLVRYTVDGRCPTSLVQRYLETPEEGLARQALRGRSPGHAVALAAEAPGGRRWAVWLAPAEVRGGSGSPIQVLLDLSPSPGGMDLTLHANQLRGYAYNTGVLGNAAVERLRLVVRDADGVLLSQTAIAQQRVGWTGESTPLRVSLPGSPPDGARLSLAADLLPEAEPRVWDGVAHTRIPVEIPLDAPAEAR